MKQLTFIAAVLLFAGPAFAERVPPHLIASSAVLTPNGDGINDWVNFAVPDTEKPLSQAGVFSLKGSKIAELVSLSPTRLGWNGLDSTGRTVESGIYLIQIVQQGMKPWTGVVNVAK
jgi:hypothetical protein